MVRALPSNVEGEGLIPGWEAKIQKKKKNNRSNIVTNSIKTLQMVHIKKRLKKKNKTQSRELPGGPAVRARRFHCLGPGLIPGQGTNGGVAKKKKQGQGKYYLCKKKEDLRT